MLCAQKEYTGESMTVDAFPRSKPHEENFFDRSEKSDPPGMVVVPNLAMNNRPKLHIPNGYSTKNVSSPTQPTFSQSRIHADPWSPSAVKLSFFFGNDPDPDPRGNLLDPRGYGLSQSATDLRDSSLRCERAVPVFVPEPKTDNTNVSVDEEEYVTLDYNYVPVQSRCVSWAVPGSNDHTDIKFASRTVPKVDQKFESKGEYLDDVSKYNVRPETTFETWTLPRSNNNHNGVDDDVRDRHSDISPHQKSASRILRYPDSLCESGNNPKSNGNRDACSVSRSKPFQEVMCDFRTMPPANHTQDIKGENRGIPRTVNHQCVKSPRGSFNPGFVPWGSFESSVLHVRENTPPVYSRHMSMENGKQTVSQRREMNNIALQKVSETNVRTIATFTPTKNVTQTQAPASIPLTQKLRKRNRSLPDLQIDLGAFSCNFSDDEDGDDFGFLSYPFLPSCFTTAAMNKAKSPTPGHKILPKRWRSKTKPLSNTVVSSLWSPETSCTWCSVSGRKVILKPISLFHLTEAERLALQKLALAKLQEMDLGCPLVIPKENGDSRRAKRHTISLKRRSKSANLGSLLDVLTDKTKEKEQKETGLVFGIPLSKCISNDHKLKRAHSASTSTLKARSESADILMSPRPRKSSSSSQSSMDNAPHNGGMLTSNPAYRRTASSDSLSESESSRNTSSSLIDALSLSMSDSRHSSLRASQMMYGTGKPQVPEVVQVCFRHLETYGLRVLGIFRVGAAKKRVKQLRDEFDSGKESPLDESHQPHDVGALLKEYFRDLPEPLLTRDLYQAFIATRKIKDRQRQLMAMRLLVALLPLPSRDTFWALVKFLHKVAQHSVDYTESNGNILPGNKMDSHNLATLFGPNILHKAKVSEKEFLVECTEQAEQSKEVIEVIKDMIDNHHEIFEITAELHDEVIRKLMETNPEMADKVLKRLSNESVIDPDPDTSSSVFDDSDSPSLPQSPCSEADLVSQCRRLQMSHQPIRISKSADLRTHLPAIQIEDEKKRTKVSSGEKRYPVISIERTPSPKPPRSPFSYRKPKLKSSVRDSSSPEVHLRPPPPPSRDPQHRDRPYSEGFSHSLTIPHPSYVRDNSSSSISSYLSSPNSPAGSEGSVQWASHSPSCSPNLLRRSSSQSRPLNLQTGEARRDGKSTVGSAEWQRESWHRWELIAAEKGADTYEQETLV